MRKPNCATSTVEHGKLKNHLIEVPYANLNGGRNFAVALEKILWTALKPVQAIKIYRDHREDVEKRANFRNMIN